MKVDPQQIYIRLVGKHHMSPIIACAFLGNMQQECGFECTIEGFDGTGSTGLCQWLGPRLSALKEFAKKKKLNWEDWFTQVDFIIHELATTENLAYRKICRAQTVSSAALAISKYYERPAARYAHNDKRMHYALDFYREFVSNVKQSNG